MGSAQNVFGGVCAEPSSLSFFGMRGLAVSHNGNDACPVRTGSKRQHRRPIQIARSIPSPPSLQHPVSVGGQPLKFMNPATKALAACWERGEGVTPCENLGEDPGSPAHQGSTVDALGYAQGMRRVCAGEASEKEAGLEEAGLDEAGLEHAQGTQPHIDVTTPLSGYAHDWI